MEKLAVSYKQALEWIGAGFTSRGVTEDIEKRRGIGKHVLDFYHSRSIEGATRTMAIATAVIALSAVVEILMKLWPK